MAPVQGVYLLDLGGSAAVFPELLMEMATEDLRAE